MSTQPIDLLVTDAYAVPLSGVEVVVFSSSLQTVYARGTTGADGKVTSLLPGGFAAEVRFFHPAARVRPRTSILIPDSPSELSFVLATWTAPISLDSRVCMVWGFAQNPSGLPRPGLQAIFKTGDSPLLYSSSPYVTGQVAVKANEEGYFELPLFRCTKVRVLMEGVDDESLFFQVPDAANANLFDLVFPYVSAFSFEPAPPYALAVNEEKNVVLDASWSDQVVRQGSPDEYIEWSSSDESIVQASGSLFNLSLRGVAAGSVSVSARRVRSSAPRVPSPPIAGSPITVTVA